MKKNIEYCWDERYIQPSITYDVDDFLLPSRSDKSGCPMKKISAFYGGAKNAFKDYFKQHIGWINGQNELGDGTRSTLRVCAGVNDLFSRALVYVAPSDIAITYTSDHTLISNVPNDSASFYVTKHTMLQTEYDDGGNLLHDRIAIKLIPPFRMRVPCDWTFMEPTWHTDYTPLKVMSGIVKKGVTSAALFLEAPIVDDVNHLEIRKGQPLAYMYFMDDVNLSLKETDFKEPARQKFIRGFK
jgi:hypothetical protein